MLQLKTKSIWTKRLARGLVVLFGIKVCLIGAAMSLESCQSNEENYKMLQREESLSSFETLVRNTTPKIKQALEEQPALLKNPEILDQKNVQKLGQDVKNILQPMVASTKQLLKWYEVEEEFLTQEFTDPNDPRIALIGLFLLAAERQEKQEVALNFAQAFGTFTYAQDAPNNELSEARPDWVECMIIAVGIDAVVEFFKGNVTEAIAKKAIKKIASRALGVVGAAVALYEFGSCMGWY
jgi:hypothetical protein